MPRRSGKAMPVRPAWPGSPRSAPYRSLFPRLAGGVAGVARGLLLGGQGGCLGGILRGLFGGCLALLDRALFRRRAFPLLGRQLFGMSRGKARLACRDNRGARGLLLDGGRAIGTRLGENALKRRLPRRGRRVHTIAETLLSIALHVAPFWS